MNVNIYLEDTLYKQLSSFSKKMHLNRNLIIRIALKEWLQAHAKKDWPQDFFNMEGCEDFPSAEELRKGLKEPPEDPLR